MSKIPDQGNKMQQRKKQFTRQHTIKIASDSHSGNGKDYKQDPKKSSAHVVEQTAGSFSKAI